MRNEFNVGFSHGSGVRRDSEAERLSLLEALGVPLIESPALRNCIAVKFRMFIDPLDEQFGPFGMPRFQKPGIGSSGPSREVTRGLHELTDEKLYYTV